MASTITWSDLIHRCASRMNLGCDEVYLPLDSDPRLWDGDEIEFSHEGELGINMDEVELAFQNGPAIRWWKEVQAYDANDRRVASLGAQDDDHALKFTRINVNDLRGGKFIFEKAKMFGVHTGMYQLFLSEDDINFMAGKRLTFMWVRD